MELTPDTNIFFQLGPLAINATLVFSWLVMALLVGVSWLVTRDLETGPEVSRWQSVLETIVSYIQDQISEIVPRGTEKYLPFIGTLFLFISISNLLSIIPGYETPTSSLSTTAALAICVFVAVPFYGILEQGFIDYMKHYVQPSAIMLPFRIISEISRTFALAVRLFGNMMSGGLLVAIILSIVPLFVPILLQAFELLIGQIQAYIFAILALVYIGSAVRVREEAEAEGSAPEGQEQS